MNILARLMITILLLVFSSTAISLQSKPAQEIRIFLEGLDAGGPALIAGVKLNQPGLLSDIYRSREHAPLWLKGASLYKEIPALLKAIDESVAHGFVAERYHKQVLEKWNSRKNESFVLATELLLTDAFLGQAIHRAHGVVNPTTLDKDWLLPRDEVDPVALLLNLGRSDGSVLKGLDDLWPSSSEYVRLLEKRAEILDSEETVSVKIEPGPLLRPGQSSERVLFLKQRLIGPADHSAVYDDRLRDEVQAFQRAIGLEPDGIVGANTLAALNASKVDWIDRIDANLERWRWLQRETPADYIRVNIAAFTLRVMEQNETTLSMNVIVGQPFRRTPVFTETIKYLVLNPYWNIPFKLATQDKLPLLKTNPADMANKGYEAKSRQSEQFLSVETIDWGSVTARNFDYQLRQKPGNFNALGRIKFMLPNEHAIYLHDTPNPELFARQERIFSSGCIRLEKPFELAEWLLSREHHPDTKNLRELLDSGSTTSIHLKQPVPAYLVYFTAFSLEEGLVIFRRDVYERDDVLVRALREL